MSTEPRRIKFLIKPDCETCGGTGKVECTEPTIVDGQPCGEMLLCTECLAYSEGGQ